MSELRVELYDVKVTDGYWLRRVVRDRLRCEVGSAADLIDDFARVCRDPERRSEESVIEHYCSVLGEIDRYAAIVPLLRSLDLITEACYSRLDDYYKKCRRQLHAFYEDAVYDVPIVDSCVCVDDEEVDK